MALSHQPKNFDVFLSFRGEDTRYGFVSHLYKALDQQGIRTFIDDNLHRGENISEALLKTIENSSASIIVFSKNYASSSWCLDELVKIIKCTQKVLPVFYQVDPSEVRKQTGDFGKALAKLEKKIKDKTKIQRWRDALSEAANRSGWEDKNSCTESELVQKIVEEISNSEFIQMPSNDATMQLVGINSRMEAVAKFLNIESNDVRMVGITGLGGIGKTTIAKAIYHSFSNHFKAKSFVENVREGSKTEEGKIRLQQTLLKGILEDKNLSVDTLYEARINQILRLKKVLIILDDVDNADQIETLLGKCEGFAFGSRIILTTRYKSLLVNRNGLSTYDYGVKELDEDEAIELFRMHAFPSNEVLEDYLELEKQVISYAKGLPLALKVMGRDLCEKPTDYWEDALDCYKTNPHEDIQNILKRSYEGLTNKEKNIFLDIACFFKEYGMRYDMIKDVLKACGLNPEYGIRNLIDKCLLTFDRSNYLSMHDLLQQMGMDIVRQQAPQKLGERSRLWCYEEALDVLTKDMKFESVTYVDFSGCDLITKIPDLSLTPNITRLILLHCKNLVEIDDSVGRLDKLKLWNLWDCKKLETLPNCLEMKSLKRLNLLGCGRLKKFPIISPEMKGLESLNMMVNHTFEFPPSFGNLIGLKNLLMCTEGAHLLSKNRKRKEGARLPDSIYNLQHIESLELTGNFIFPKNVEIDRQPMCDSLGCSSKYVFPRLRKLRLNSFEIHTEIKFILNYCCPRTLKELEIYDINCHRQNPKIVQDISLQSGLGLPMDTESGLDLVSALDSSNVDGFDLGSSSVDQPSTPQVKKKKSKTRKTQLQTQIRSDRIRIQCL
ncbi:disease resistance protein RPV1 isoform X3 [Quercus suber]|uniref:disease resistance protein RPV1 isoform X3 n=1 Tax=Quercus suber TaxID=58331 RepID=UPI0032DE4835